MKIPAVDNRLESVRKENEKFVRFLETGAAETFPKSVRDQIRIVCSAQMGLRDELELLQTMVGRMKEGTGE